MAENAASGSRDLLNTASLGGRHFFRVSSEKPMPVPKRSVSQTDNCAELTLLKALAKISQFGFIAERLPRVRLYLEPVERFARDFHRASPNACD